MLITMGKVVLKTLKAKKEFKTLKKGDAVFITLNDCQTFSGYIIRNYKKEKKIRINEETDTIIEYSLIKLVDLYEKEQRNT